MQKTLTIGRTYAVTTASICDVTDANGTLITTATAGQQAVFVAPSTTVTFSDDSASVVAVFKLALAKIRSVSSLGGGYLSRGYRPVLFLESSGAQRIDTRIKSTGDSIIEVDMVPVKYLWINTIFGDSQLNYLSDGTRIPRTYLSFNFNNAHEKSLAFAYGNQSWDGEYMAHYYADGTLLATAVTFGNRYKFRADKNNLFINGNQARKYKIGTPLYEEFESAYSLMLFGGRHQPNLYGYSNMRVYEFSLTNGIPVDSGGAKECRFIPALDPAGTPCMFDKITRKPFYNSGSGAFVVGLTAQQALQLTHLPSGGGTLTVSVPQAILDAEGNLTDAAVKTALDKAAANNWTIKIQYYNN